MLRNIADICASEKRINWSPAFKKGLYKERYPRWYNDVLTIGAITYTTYLAEQQPLLPGAMELVYEDLKHFPEWIPKDQRIKFKDRQWKQ